MVLRRVMMCCLGLLMVMGVSGRASAACTRHQVYSSSMGRCIPKSVTCSRNQVYSSSMGRCIPKSVTCSPNQVYSSSVHACIPKG